MAESRYGVFPRRLTVLLAAAVFALLAAASANAWSQYFVQSATWGAGSQDNSGYNSNLVGIAVYFDNRYGGMPQMGSRYINSSGDGLTSWRWSNTGSIIDERDIAYGAAQCKANDGNGYSVYVSSCYTEN